VGGRVDGGIFTVTGSLAFPLYTADRKAAALVMMMMMTMTMTMMTTVNCA